MSKGSRLRAQRASEPPFRSGKAALREITAGRFRPGIEIAIMPGACINTEREIASIRQRTHDGLIAMLGHRRRSGIWWNLTHGAADCHDILDRAYPPEAQTPEARAALAEFHEYFDVAGDQAVLVIATCEAMPA